MKGKYLLKGFTLVVCLLMLSASTVLAGPLEGVPCNGNFDGDVDVDAEDVVEFLVHYGRNQYNDPCPATVCPITCSGTLSALGRWCDQGDGTVKDMTTGLVWLQKADWGGLYAFWVDTMSGVNAQDRAAKLWDGSPYEGTAGLSDGSVEGDWRLPTKTELYNLANGTEAVSSVSMQLFTGVQFDDVYWSSTSGAGDPHYAWSVEMNVGGVGGARKNYGHYVWPVRGDIN